MGIARESRRYEVLTKNTYRNTVLKESQIAAMEEFIDNIRILLGTLGYKVLEPVLKKNENDHSDAFYINIGNASAEGRITAEGFVLLSGARINEKTNTGSLSNGMVKLRTKHIESDHVVDYVTTEDILFSSSSAAADFVLGYSVSGPATWKNCYGDSLRESESKENT